MSRIYSTSEMIKFVVNSKGKCIEARKIINQDWHSTYFIFHKKTFKNGKINFGVNYDSGEQNWTNFDFIEFYKDDKWYFNA